MWPTDFAQFRFINIALSRFDSSSFSTSWANRVRGKVAVDYGMRCIAGLRCRKLTVRMGHKRPAKDEIIESNGAKPPGWTPNQQHLQGASRLVNPRKNDAEIVGREDDPVEQDYVGRLLHVADEALHRVKRGGEHRKRRRVH